MAALALWGGTGEPLWLGLASLAAGFHLLPSDGSVSWAKGGARLLLLLALMSGFLAEGQIRGVMQDWDSIRLQRENRLAERLADELDGVLEEGEGAAAAAAALEGLGGFDLADGLARIRRGTRVDALAVYDGRGQLMGWDGLHQGAVPEQVMRGEGRYLYTSQPLFGYLYISSPLPREEGTAVAAVLLHADLPPGLGQGLQGLAEAFEDRWGGRLTITLADRASGEGIWDLGRGDETLFSVALESPSQTQVLTETRARWVGLVLVLTGLFWVLSLAVHRLGAVERWGAAASLLILAAWFPVTLLPGPDALSTAVDFVLPGPGDASLGRLLLLAIAGMVAVALVPRDLDGIHPTGAAFLGAALLVGLAHWMAAGAAPHLLAGSEADWIAYFLTSALVFSLGVGVVVRLSRSEQDRYPAELLLLASALAGVALALGVATSARVPQGVSPWAGLFWALPMALVAGVFVRNRPGLEAARWLVIAVLGGTLALPMTWGQRLEARADLATDEMERLNTPVDPYLEFLLLGLGDRLEEARARTSQPVELLYRGWVESGMVWEGVPLWLTYWSPGGLPLDELRIGVPGARPVLPLTLTGASAPSREVEVLRLELPDVHYLAVLPLSDGALVTAAVPPRRMVARVPTTAGFSPSVGGDAGDVVSVVPVARVGAGEADAATGAGPSEVRWARTEGGWHGELSFQAPEQDYQAHVDLSVASPGVRWARASLLLLLHILFLGLVWGLCTILPRGPPEGRLRIPTLLGTFRARVTVALFAFFLAPTVLLGTLIQGALATASVRTAQTLAERSVDEAARWYDELQGSMELLAGRATGELLLYQGGELVTGSPRELVELGLYPGWLPSDVHFRLQMGETLLTSRILPLAGRDHALAFRRLSEDGVLAAAAPVQAGASALRQRDLLDLLAFAILVGAALSLGLAVLVGRALSRPIQALRVASERVGSGNLGVRLPPHRSDEFGPVFEAFDRMVRRLRRARRDLIRSARRTRAIVEEAATGVIALDPAGRVTLSNPRAAVLLGGDLVPGQPIHPGSEVSGDLARWVDLYFGEGLKEAATELAWGDRRIKVKARRISREGASGGAVLSLEDVTDELRSERILAWGEMARQVAHEVKNPLTPVKLGIQHIRRAWQDQREDFGLILERNASAILDEIDRLAAIATSFSRFGAPGVAGEEPLQPVRLDDVVAEMMTLYAAGDDGVRVMVDMEPELPTVQARASELKEVLVNLLENARQAMPDGGDILVRGTRFGNGVILEVTDEGMGIEPEFLPRIFEPHFSTRGTGSGLGLAIVNQLVESWGGGVEAQSDVSVGTAIRVFMNPWDGSTGSLATAEYQGEPRKPAGGGLTAHGEG
ncbi:MAG: ATP-binding protein [Gemmatimonadota bacterium]